MGKRPNQPPASQLRTEAEARLAHAPSIEIGAAGSGDLLHELQVHQIELEMQNDELRRILADLEESRDRNLELYEFAPVGYVTLTRLAQIGAINLTGAGLLGQDRGELLRRRFARCIAAEDKDRWHRFFVGAMGQHERQVCELTLQRADGSRFDARLDCLPPEGNPPVMRIVLTDVTERRSAERQLRAREDRLHLAKTATGLGIYDRDILHGKLDWDERMREIWGVGAEETVDYATFMRGVHPDDRPATHEALNRAFDPHGSGESSADFRVVSHADGSIRHVRATGHVFFENERAVRLIGTVKDISAQKQLEREVQERRNEMELLVHQQVAAQTAAAIAHELNQPLIAVSVYSETALHMLRDGVKYPEKLAHALEGAVAQSQRAGRTLHELLAFLYKGETQMEPIDLNEVVRESLALAEESGYGGFRQIVHLDAKLAPVLANRLQIQKVLVNLLHNGVEAMRGAEVARSAVTITVQTHASKNLAQVTVQDSGPGVDANIAQRIFDPFFTTKPDGVGLGLAISRALIEAHGGQLWADLDAGPGAVFHFTLPFAP
jgi:PAS domain S-box-containing protein